MKAISVKKRTKGASKDEQEKLDILTRDFERLEENWKEYIWELTRKLVDIHCGGGFSVEFNGNNLAHGEISGIIRL
ncbi:hypothetical protein R84B8_01601 [Treponema sp. R8-4-B8]